MFRHTPIMIEEVLEGFNGLNAACFVDATLGGAGHAQAIIKSTSPSIFIGIDRDKAALDHARAVLGGMNMPMSLIHANHNDIAAIQTKMFEHGVSKIDAVLMDLGVSSHHLDTAERGFSYNHEAALDMRMNQEDELTAYDVVNGYEVTKLIKILRDYGEERFAVKIANSIDKIRKVRHIKTTTELAEIIKEAIPAATRRHGGHPARRSFQAIRIEVNNELALLEQSIRQFIGLLSKGGRICIISFHSAEDRIVKRLLTGLANPCTCSKDFPVCICKKLPIIDIITKKPIIPTEEEVLANPRARSAKLRIAQKL